MFSDMNYERPSLISRAPLLNLLTYKADMLYLCKPNLVSYRACIAYRSAVEIVLLPRCFLFRLGVSRILSRF